MGHARSRGLEKTIAGADLTFSQGGKISSSFPFPSPTCPLKPSLLKRDAHTVGVYRTEFLGPPRLGLQRTVGMHSAAPLLVFDVQCFNTLHGQSNHGLVADLPGQDFVIHASDVEVRFAAVDTCISWRSSVAKSFLEAADLGPPLQRFRSVGSRQNRDRAFNDRVFNGHVWLHRHSLKRTCFEL